MTETEALLDLEYHYDEGIANTGRIMQISDHNDTSRSVSYDYDEFGRLTAAETAGSHWGLAWNYDLYGNQLSQSLTKGTGPTRSFSVDANTNRVNGFTYDAAGNVLDDGANSYVYDARNMVTEVNSGEGQYKYDAQGSRVARTTAFGTTLYFFGVGEYQVGSGWQKLFVFQGREKLAQYSSGKTWFFHTDHLGTPRIESNVLGGVSATWSSYPFGEIDIWEVSYAGFAGNYRLYSGHLRDSESGNYYAGARYYASLQARWLSVDPALGDLANPQRLNRYSYVLNDPVNYIDPDGRSECPVGHYCPPGGQLDGNHADVFGSPYPDLSYYLPGGAGPSPFAWFGMEIELGLGETAGAGLFSSTVTYRMAIDAAVARAIARIRANSRCREFLGDNAAGILDQMHQSGRIVAADLGAYEFGIRVIHAQWDPVRDVISLNTEASFFNPEDVGGSNYLFSFNSLYDGTLTPDQYQEYILLHELGHKVGVLPADAGNEQMTRQNEVKVLWECFGVRP